MSEKLEDKNVNDIEENNKEIDYDFINSQMIFNVPENEGIEVEQAEVLKNELNERVEGKKLVYDRVLKGSFSEEPVIEPITNKDLVCKDCRFATDGGVLECHKYSMKPAKVIDGGECLKYMAKLNQ